MPTSFPETACGVKLSGQLKLAAGSLLDAHRGTWRLSADRSVAYAAPYDRWLGLVSVGPARGR